MIIRKLLKDLSQKTMPFGVAYNRSTKCSDLLKKTKHSYPIIFNFLRSNRIYFDQVLKSGLLSIGPNHTLVLESITDIKEMRYNEIMLGFNKIYYKSLESPLLKTRIKIADLIYSLYEALDNMAIRKASKNNNNYRPYVVAATSKTLETKTVIKDNIKTYYRGGKIIKEIVFPKNAKD